MSVMLEDGAYMDFIGEITSLDKNNNIRASFDVSAGKGKSFYGLDDITDIEQLDMIYDGEYDIITYYKVSKKN